MAAHDMGAADYRTLPEAIFTSVSARQRKHRSSIRASATFRQGMEISEMSKIIGVAAAMTVIVVAIIIWSKFAVVRPEAAAATNAAAADGRPIISPFDTTIKQGKNLPLEDWRPAN
jgi:hypothetical protein